MFTPGHKKARLFITHGGQNSLLQAVYHAVPVLGIPLFGDQFDNVVRAETKGLGLSIRPTHITRQLLRSAIQTLIQDTRYVDGWLSIICDGTEMQVTTPLIAFFSLNPNHFSFSRFKTSALSCSRIHKSHPVPPGLRLIQWVDHILHTGGGAHLRPTSLSQPWYQRYLLDVVLLLSLGLLGPVLLCSTFCRNKNHRIQHKKIQ